MEADILFSREKHLGLVTLNRPQTLNALNLSMIIALQQQLKQWESDTDIHAVVIKSEGGKAFCAGGDVRTLYEAGRAKHDEQMQFFWHEYRLNHFIYQFKKPYIALLDGMTMGGGVGISLHGSHPIATERFIFAMPETGIGFFPDIGASYLLARCKENIGIYLGLTGNRLTAANAFGAGLVKKVIASEHMDKLLERLIQEDLSSNAFQRVDECLEAFTAPVVSAPLDLFKDIIQHCFSKGTVEETLSELNALKNEWALAVIDTLNQKAPLSLKITLAQLLKAKQCSFAECLQMDYCLVKHFMRDSDFYEGIRALLIDKDKTPHWQPKHLDLVSVTKIETYFKQEGESLNFLP